VSFLKRKKDRRRPENAERRQLIDHLRDLADRGQKLAVEHQLAEAERRTEETSARLNYLNAAVRVMRRG
jgi:transcription elongation GreA/GreB family factor